jgi:hemerythrin
MAQFSWTNNLFTGNTLIDGDHRKLVDFMNAFFESMQSGETTERISKAMQDFIAFTREHFRREDEEMRRIGYVAALAHATEHGKLLKQLVELKDMLDARGNMNSSAIAMFLSGWLRNHILTADMKLAAALTQRPSPAPARGTN